MKRLRLSWLFAGMVCIVLSLSYVTMARAAVLLDRSVRVLDPKPGVNTSHVYAFFIQNSNSVGSMVLEYCTNDPFFDNPCTVPAGLDASSATLTSQAGETGFSIDGTTTANRIVLTRPAVPTNVGQAQFAFGNIINPSTINQQVYVRISLHGSADGSGPRTDEGAVVFIMTRSLDTRAYVPPHLTFCAGITVALDCTSANGFYVDMGEFRKNSANIGTSQYSTATNDLTGYSVSMFGETMTSGNKFIPAMNSPGASLPGISQFGVNAVDNSNPDVGQNPTGPGTAILNPSYGIGNNFKYGSGDVISSAAQPSDFNIVTLSYVVNVSPNQAPGIYNSTFTFVAVASF